MLQMARFPPFLWLSNIHKYITFFLTYLTADEYLSCFSVLAIINNTLTSIKARTSFPDSDFRSSHHGSVVTNLISIHEDVSSIPALTQWVKGPMLQ